MYSVIRPTRFQSSAVRGMAFALAAPRSLSLILTVVESVSYCGFRLTSRGAVASVVPLAVGSIAIASAVLLILDLSDPYSGGVRASSTPFTVGDWRSWAR